MKTVEFDIIFLSYDEPNADLHYANLCNIAPWAKRVHGIKGSDAAHKAAAELSETEWFITVDADNIVYPSFFDLDLDMSDPKIQVYGWCGRNSINGLRYGNGGLKIWKKDFVLNMRTHEASDSERGQVDFCWEDGYKNFPRTYSDSIITDSPFQAWRAGFREGVKMTLLDGVKVPPQEIKEQIWWHNIHRLRMWSTVGAHKDNGLFAILGARQGTYMANCTEWDYVQVRDFEELRRLYNETVKDIETNTTKITEMIADLGELLKTKLGLDWPNFDAQESKYVVDLYEETINLNNTYYQQCTI
jgi:hypothetical protein